jgi:hypothetical protein
MYLSRRHLCRPDDGPLSGPKHIVWINTYLHHFSCAVNLPIPIPNFLRLVDKNLRGCTASKLTNGLLKIRTLRSSLFWDDTQRRLLAASSLKMGSIGCPETSVTNYQYTLRNIPEE